MKFENFEVEEMFYELHKKYGVRHCNLGSRYNDKPFTAEDLVELEECFQRTIKFLEDK